MDTARTFVSEGLATALLLAIVVGSGIMAERLSQGNVALALLCNALATGAGLIALILVFKPSSGAHMNPVVTLADASRGGTPWAEVPARLVAQVGGAVLGTGLANLMFGLPAWTLSSNARAGLALGLSELVATFGLVGVIFSVSRRAPAATPFAVAAWIVSAYWFTASTSFANPAVTLARALTDTFTGIRLADVPGFVLAQLLGAGSAALVFGWLAPREGARKAARSGT